MNTFKKAAALGAIALASAGTAYSQLDIKFAASNGDRNATQTAIGHLLTTWKYVGTSGTVTGNSSTTLSNTVLNSNFGTWYGVYNGQNITIRTNYAGALAGIAAVAGNLPQKFDVSTGAEPVGTGPESIIPNPIQHPTAFVEYPVDFGFSTNFQSTSPFLGPYKGHTYQPIKEYIVGASPLGFYASPGFPANNITTQQAQILYTSGVVPLALFTGDWVADKNKTVWAIGRNTDAGQRYGAYAEIGLGTSRVVKVYQPTITGQVTPAGSGITYGGVVQSHIPWPEETISGIPSAEGNGGYNSGANLAAILTVTLGPNAYRGYYSVEEDGETFEGFLFPNATAGYYIGYVTPGDAGPRILGTTGVVPPEHRGVALNYNGIELTTANVQNGQYTAWLYNRVITPNSWDLLNNPQPGLQAFVKALHDQIRDFDAPAGGGIIEATLNVRRFTDGGLVTGK